MHVRNAVVELELSFSLLVDLLHLRVVCESFKTGKVSHTVGDVSDGISESESGLKNCFEVSGKSDCYEELGIRIDRECSFVRMLLEVRFLGQQYIKLRV